MTRANEGHTTASGWLVSPAFDLCFVANLWWPLIAIAGLALVNADQYVSFWQIYFLTTPHRWLTLILVLTDPDRRAGRVPWLVGLAILSAVAVLGAWLFTGGLLCLAVVDYLWNAWHFGSQHAGIGRMYARRAGVMSSPWQTWGLRCLVVYTSVRLAGWSTGWLEVTTIGVQLLRATDLAAAILCTLAIAIALWRNHGAGQRSWQIYIASVTSLYLLLLLAINLRQPGLVAALVVASAAFHAIEYLAIVTFYAQRRKSQGSGGMFQTMAHHWSLLLGLYLVLLGGLAFITDQTARQAWLSVNLWVAFLHYAYDGMIWKLRDAKTAQVLSVELPSTSGVG